MISYKNAIDTDFGQYTIKDDIITTPFWTKAFCNELVEIAEEFKDRFAISDYGTEELLFSQISRLLLEDYAKHVQNGIIPMVEKEWFLMDISGIWSPFILRYKMDGVRSLRKHTDQSIFSISVKLNDNYTGCHLQFPRQNFSAEYVPVGHALIWPSIVTHPHYTTELTSGVRYSLSSFVWPCHWTDSHGYKF